MVRIATVDDAEQLGVLNGEFNGENETTVEAIRSSLAGNPQEVVVVDEEDGVLRGFVCVQLKRSFCYGDCAPEITEVYVCPAYRRRGIASGMIRFAEEYCLKNCALRRFELLTGEGNRTARSLYDKLGYNRDHELHLSKRVRG